MASGHVNRTQRPNTWLHRPSLQREDSPCQLGAVHTWPKASLGATQRNVCTWVNNGRRWSALRMTQVTHFCHSPINFAVMHDAVVKCRLL